jgi:hypothetical protein
MTKPKSKVITVHVTGLMNGVSRPVAATANEHATIPA